MQKSSKMQAVVFSSGTNFKDVKFLFLKEKLSLQIAIVLPVNMCICSQLHTAP